MINNVANDTIKEIDSTIIKDQVNCENLSAINESVYVKDENSLESCTSSDKNADEDEKHLKDLKGRLTLPLETVLELENGDTTQDFNKSQVNQATPVLPHQQVHTPTTATSSTSTRPRNRTDSLKLFTDKFRSISNDLLRSIESAHEMIDLNRSHFSAATQLAAVQQYQSNENHLTPSSINNKSFKSRNNSAHPMSKQRSSTIAASKNEPVADYAIVKTGSINDIISNLPSGSLSSYGLVNENESDANGFNSLNRDSLRKNKHYTNSNDNDENYFFKRISDKTNVSNERNDSTEEAVSNKESCYYSPKSKFLRLLVI